MIPYGRQDIRQEDLDAVLEVLQSDFLTQGPAVPKFEQAVASATGAKFAVAMNSATSALHVACAALDLGPGDYLWTSPNTFVASANCGRYCGASVDFVDIDPHTANLCPQKLADKLAAAKKSGKLPKVLVAVHLTGQSCDMEAIGAIAKKYGVRVIEDASHAIGGFYHGAPVGDCAFSDITIFSFHPVKIVTTAEGGLATTQDRMLANRMARLRSHGITRDASEMTHAPDGPWYYQQIELGWNYRMTDMQAALGASQMARLSQYIATRNMFADRYDQLLADLPIALPGRQPDTLSAFHLYVIRVAADRHRAIFEGLRERGIGVNLHYIPVHLQPYYREMGFGPGHFPEAERYYAEAISIPLFATMTESMQDEVVAAIAAEVA